MYVKGHHNEQDLGDRVFKLSAEFHKKPKEIKQECYTHNLSSKELKCWNELFMAISDGPVRMWCSFATSKFEGLTMSIAKNGYELNNDLTSPQLSVERRAMCLVTYDRWSA